MTNRFFRASPFCVRAKVIDDKGDPVSVNAGDGEGIAYAVTRQETEDANFANSTAEFGESLIARVALDFDVPEAVAMELPEGETLYRIAGRNANGAVGGAMARLNYVEFELHETQ